MSRSFLSYGMVTLAAVAFGDAAARAGSGSGRRTGRRNVVAQWSIITGGFALAFAAAFGALGQAKGSARPSRASRATRAPRARSAAT